MQSKRFLVIFLTVILTCFLAVSIFAAEDDPLVMAVEVSSSTAIPNQSGFCITAGDTVTVKITVDTPDLIMYNFSLKYNKEAFTLVGTPVFGDAAIKTPEYSNVAGVFGFYYAELPDFSNPKPVLSSGTFVTLTFQATEWNETFGPQDFELNCSKSDFTTTDFGFVSKVEVTNDALELHDFDKVETKGNCVENGYTTYSCKHCDKVIKIEGTTEALGHIDENKDHKCDRNCGVEGSEELNMDQHVDVNFDHVCDYGCETPIGACVDENFDHACDYTGCTKVFGTCEDVSPKDHKCDYGCTKTYGEHTDSATDTDHICDYCQSSEVLENCADKDGDNDHKCDICGKDDVTAHDYAPATCDAPSTCKECSATTGEALKHEWLPTGKYQIKPATCIKYATYYYECKHCGVSSANVTNDYYEDIGADYAPHDFIEKAISTAKVSDANCNSGTIYWTICSVCTITSEGQIAEKKWEAADKLTHNDKAGDGDHLCDLCNEVVTEHTYVDAVCTVASTCTECGETTGKPLGHDFVEQNTDAKYLKSEATCTAKAVYYKSCNRTGCDEKGTETFEYGNALGHDFVEQNTDAKYLKDAATCTTKAVYYKSCNRTGCDEKGTETFESGEPLGHKFDKETATDAYKATDATCTDKATYYKSCSVCTETSKGATGEATFEHGDLADHAVEDLMKIEAVEPTCTATGLTEGEYCAKCTATTIEQTVVAAKGHVLGDWVVEIEPKIGKEGKQTKTCSVCNSVVETEAIEAKSALPIILIIVAVVVVGGGVGTFFVLKNKKADEESSEDAE